MHLVEILAVSSLVSYSKKEIVLWQQKTILQNVFGGSAFLLRAFTPGVKLLSRESRPASHISSSVKILFDRSGQSLLKSTSVAGVGCCAPPCHPEAR